MNTVTRFHRTPLTKAARYEPVQSKIAPDIQPPSAIPNSVARTTVAIRVPASAGEKNSRTTMA